MKAPPRAPRPDPGRAWTPRRLRPDPFAAPTSPRRRRRSCAPGADPSSVLDVRAYVLPKLCRKIRAVSGQARFNDDSAELRAPASPAPSPGRARRRGAAFAQRFPLLPLFVLRRRNGKYRVLHAKPAWPGGGEEAGLAVSGGCRAPGWPYGGKTPAVGAGDPDAFCVRLGVFPTPSPADVPGPVRARRGPLASRSRCSDPRRRRAGRARRIVRPPSRPASPLADSPGRDEGGRYARPGRGGLAGGESGPKTGGCLPHWPLGLSFLLPPGWLTLRS